MGKVRGRLEHITPAQDDTANGTESTRMDELLAFIDSERTARSQEPAPPPKGLYDDIQICGGLDSPSMIDNPPLDHPEAHDN